MKKKKTIRKSLFPTVLAIAMVASTVPVFVSPAYASTNDDIQLSFASSKEADIVLTLGQTNMDVKNFSSDLTNKLVQKGIPLDKIKISAIQTSTTTAQDTFAWQTYDHYNQYEPYGTSLPYHIYTSDKNIVMKGYTSIPYKDFLFLPDTSPSQKTFTFTLAKDGTDWHSMEGGGFLFNTKIENNLISGYEILFTQSSIKIYQLSGVDLNSFRNGNAIGSLIKTFPFSTGTTTHDLKIVTTPTALNVWDSGSQIITNYAIPTLYGNGYGPITSFASHGCSQVSYFTFGNIVMSTIEAKNFSDVIKQPSWSDYSGRFLVNVEDKANPDFDSPTALGTILPRLSNESINYIGLGTSQNQTQAQNFIAQNNGNGAFYLNTDYNSAIENTATYIANELKAESAITSQYVEVGQPINISVNPPSLATNTQTTDYPQGRWKIDHDYEYFENSLGQASWANQWQKDLPMTFDKPGKYTIWFGTQQPTPSVIYAHRKPIANFSTVVKNNSSNYGITLQDYSYDLDMQSRTDRGIAEYEWKWKKTTDTAWQSGQIPSSLPIGNNYIVQLRVKDYQGAWSEPVQKFITTASVVSQPVANFDLNPNPVSMYSNLNVNDTSYDPAGRNIIAKQWTVKKNGTQVYQGSTPITNFQSYGEGSYTVSLKVQNDANLWSDEFTRPLTVTQDTEAPEATVNPTAQSWSPNNAVVNISFTDKGGSEFKQQRYAVTQSPTPPVSTSSSWSAYDTSSSRSITISQEGKNYIHLEAVDNAGNKLTRTIGDYQIDKTAPTATYTATPSTWTNQDVIINFKASDNVSGVNRVKLPNGNWVTDTDVAYVVSSNGVQDFVVVDNAGNTVSQSIPVNNIDKITPNAPTLTLNGAENTWISQDVIATIKDNGDGGVSGYHTEYSLSGATTQGWTTYNAPVTITNDGITTISARVVDNAGNISSVVSKTVNIDQDAPNLTITPDIANLTNTDIVLTAKATDTATGVKRIQLPDGNWVNGSQATYRVSQNGTYIFQAEDNYGHVKTVNQVVSNIKKNVLITNKREVDLALHAEDLYSGVTDMQFRNEEEPWTAWESYSTYKDWVLSPVDGLKHVWVQYKDKVGNIAPPVEDIIILDMTKPTASSFVINDDAPYTKTKAVTLKLKGSDALTGVKDIYLSNDNQTWTKMPYTEETPWLLSDGDGVKTVYLKISDVAGNISDIRTDTIFLDTTKPLANIVINNGDAYSATRDVKLTLTYSDIGGSGIDTVKVIEGDREYTIPKPTPNSPITIPWTLDFGVVRTVSIVAVDKAGNVSDIGSDSIIVDKLTINQFTLEDVVNPLEFNAINPYTPKVWAFAPQPMLSGGNITFSIDVKKAVDQEVVQDKVDYKVEVIGDNGYAKALFGTMRKAGDHYSQTITIPKDAPNGAKVYVSATAQRKLLVSPYDIQTVYFPGGEDASQKAQIGFVNGNIYDTIRFNETH